MALYAWADYYNYTGPSLWAPSLATQIDRIMTNDCAFDFGGARTTLVSELGTHAAEIFDPTFLAAYRDGNFGTEFAAIGQAFANNRIGAYVQTAPLAIWQGDADTTVDVVATTQVVDALREGGVEVDYRIVPGGRHEDVAFGFVATSQLRTEESMDWIFSQLE